MPKAGRRKQPNPVRISFVVPAHGVERYLPGCLDSILATTGVPIEVVAVDDRSPDRCGEILDEYAARDLRVRVLHLSENVGLGQARNIGLSHTTGTYVWFVDSDDWLAEGAIDAVASRLSAARDPDVLLFDFARAFPDGTIERDIWHEVFSRDPDTIVGTLHDRPELLKTIMSAWNKVLRRDFLDSLGVEFGRGYYEDISVTYPVLLSARRLTVLDRVCYYYRRDRPGAITHSESDKHFDAFDQYGRVFTFLDAHPETQEFRRAVFDRTILQAVTILATPGLLPASSRRAFFDRLTTYFRAHRPAGYHHPGGARGVQYRLVERGSYASYQRLLALRDAGGAARRRSATISRRGRTAARVASYQAYRRLPIDDNLAVYAAYWYRGYACNPRAIYEAARELAPHVHGVWVVDRAYADRMPEDVDYVIAGSSRYLRVMATARYLVNNVNFPHELTKRPGTIHVQTQHGTPLKTLGFDLRNHPVAAGAMNFHRLAEHVDRWDYLVSPNPHATAAFRSAYPGRYTLLETGYPRNDRLVRAGAADIAAARESLGLGARETAVLYAPTFRDDHSEAEVLLDPARLAAGLGRGYVVLARAHYFEAGKADDTGGAQVTTSGGRVLDVSTHPSIEELCLAADILVTDYSSLMFDYACLDRPIVIHAPDWAAYQTMRGTYFDITTQPPGTVTTTPERLVQVLRDGTAKGREAASVRAAFRRRFCALEDGHAAERIVRRVFLGERPDETPAEATVGSSAR